MGIKRAGGTHVLGGRNAVKVSHLQHIAHTWGIPPHQMFADLARIALNLEMGRPAAEGVGGKVWGPEDGPTEADDEADSRGAGA